mgnify:CR=1 FL=1
MAGVKGRSGGARPGAGRPRKTADVQPADMEPLEFLAAVMRGSIEPTGAQLKAAIAAAKYVHQVPGVGGKKGEQAKKAESVAGGKFAARRAPLRVVNGNG